MKLKEFHLERIQSLYENVVEFNLSDSGVHPYNLRGLLSEDEIQRLCDIELGYGWTNGSPGLRQAIANLYDNRSADEVVVTNGSAEANLLLVLSQLERGDEIIVVVPNYLQIWGIAQGIGVSIKEVPLRVEQDWQLDLSAVEAAIRPNTKLITLCTPNNPTGTVMSDHERDELLALAQRHDLILHADEVYRGSELDGPEPPSFADLPGNNFVSSGMSKAMALPGLRLGWLIGPKQEIDIAWSAKDYTSISASALSEYITELVLQPQRRAAVLDRSKRILRDNRALISEWVDTRDWCSYVPPKAGGMAFVKYDLPVPSDLLAKELREEHSVLVLPGTVFGLEGHLRIGIGAPREVLEPGLKRLGDYLARHAT